MKKIVNNLDPSLDGTGSPYPIREELESGKVSDLETYQLYLLYKLQNKWYQLNSNVHN